MTDEQIKERYEKHKQSFMGHCAAEPWEQYGSPEYDSWKEKLEQLRTVLIEASDAHEQARKNRMVRKYNDRNAKLS